jgi:hypothetical protein
MTGTEGVILLLAIALLAIGLDLFVLWVWREVRRLKGAPAHLLAPAATSARSAASFPAHVARGILSIQSGTLARIIVFRQLIRLSAEGLRSERTLLRTLKVVAALLSSLSLGYVSADQSMVQLWLPWAWVACVALALFSLISPGRPRVLLNRSDRWILGLTGLAILLRVTGLETLPGGLHVDEWGAAEFALRFVVPPIDRTISPLVTGPGAQPALYFYLARLSIAAFGERIAGLRMSSVIGGSLAILATYSLVAQLHNRRAAYFAAALMATYHFHIHWSRIGLNNIWDTLWVPLVLALYVWGWRNNRPAGATFAGLALGLSQYFYAGSRVGVFLIAYLAIRLWRAERSDARLLAHASRLLGMASVVAIPLLVFAVMNPEPFFSRLTSGLLWDPFAADRTPPGYLPSVGQQAVWTLLSFTAIPEGAGFYRPGVPLVLGLGVPLLLAGVFWQIHRREWLPVVWLVLTMVFGGFLLEALPASNHYTVAIPAIVWLIVSPLEALYSLGKPRWALAGLAILIVTDLYFYFGIYSRSPSLDFVHPFPPSPYS